MFNKIMAACASLVLAASPAAAKLDAGTADLIDHIDATDIVVTINGPHCASGEYLGVYIHSGMKRQLALCPGAEIDELDHAVVRHEVFHAVQHCVNTARGTAINSPIQENTQELWEYANDVLDPAVIAFVQENYDRSQWNLEIEAMLAMEVFTAAEIQEMFNNACLADPN